MNKEELTREEALTQLEQTKTDFEISIINTRIELLTLRIQELEELEEKPIPEKSDIDLQDTALNFLIFLLFLLVVILVIIVLKTIISLTI